MCSNILRHRVLASSLFSFFLDIPIVDAAIPKQVNGTDLVGYIAVFSVRSPRLMVGNFRSTIRTPGGMRSMSGRQKARLTLLTFLIHRQVFITNPDGSEYVGQVWPGFTVRLCRFCVS